MDRLDAICRARDAADNNDALDPTTTQALLDIIDADGRRLRALRDLLRGTVYEVAADAIMGRL